MAYTTRDTPDLVRRIDSDLAHVVDTVRQADPHLRCLILTGGFARGEGMTRAGVPQNDYDFVAVRRPGRPREPYAKLAARLHTQLGLHIDLAPVPAWRLRWSPRTIFWYETLLRGRVLWGEALLTGMRAPRVEALHRGEALRLLGNRAAGLLLVTSSHDEHAVRIQAAKALLAALDVHLLAARRFAPSQTERWQAFQALLAATTAPPELAREARLLAWAYHYKTNPDQAVALAGQDAWREARRVLLAALPLALRLAGRTSLGRHGTGDALPDRIVYALRSHQVPGARRWLWNPTGRVRAATLRLLEATPDGRVQAAQARLCLAGIAATGPDALRTLAALRAATRQ